MAKQSAAKRKMLESQAKKAAAVRRAEKATNNLISTSDDVELENMPNSMESGEIWDWLLQREEHS